MTTPETLPTIITVASTSVGREAGTHEIITPSGHPNITFKVLTPVTIIAARALRAYIEGILALVTIGITAPHAMPTADFLHLLGLACSLAFAPVAISVLKNIAELLGKWDQSHPELTV